MQKSLVVGLGVLGLGVWDRDAHADVLTVGPPGSGATFEQIDPAIAAAQDGDTILVGAGSYDRFTLSKPLRILGAGRDEVFVASYQSEFATAEVFGIGAGEEAVISGMWLYGQLMGLGPWPRALRVNNCAGTVVVHDVVVRGNDALVQNTGRLLIFASQWRGATNQSGVPQVRGSIHIENSSAWVVDCDLMGGLGSCNPGCGIAGPGKNAIGLISSSLRIARSQIRGGRGGDGAFSGNPIGGIGLQATNSTIVLTGAPEVAATLGSASVGPYLFEGPTLSADQDTRSEIHGGDGGIVHAVPFYADGSVAVDLLDSDLHAQTGVLLAGGFDGEGLVQQTAYVTAGTSSLVWEPARLPTLANLRYERATTGGRAHLRLQGAAGASSLVFASLESSSSQELPGIHGVLLLDLNSASVIGPLVLNESGFALLPVDIPTETTLVGSTPWFQWYQFGAGVPAYSNPMIVSVRN